MFFTSTFGKVVSPFREVSWADFLLADVLTSLSKPLSDAERGMCHLLAGSVMEPHSSDRVSTPQSIPISPVTCKAFPTLGGGRCACLNLPAGQGM